jgi:DHA1 family tetracycline resistance protein-like MFS transporter
LTEPPSAGRAAISVILLTVFLDSVGFGIIIPVMPSLITELTGQSVNQAAVVGGWLLLVFALMQFFFAPILGALSDRFGRRPVIVLALLAFGVDYLIMGFAPTLAWLFLGRILSGIPGASFVPAYAYLADVSTPAKRAQTFGLVGTAFGVGFIVGPAMGGLLTAYGSRAPFFAAAAIAFANGAMALLVLRESLPPEKRRPLSWKRANPVGGLLQIRKLPQVFGFAWASFLWALAFQVYPSIWSFYTIYRFGWTDALVGGSLAVSGAIIALTQGVGPRFLVPRWGEARIVVAGLLVGAAGFAGFALASETWHMFALLGVWFLGALVMPTMNAMMSQQVPRDAQGELQGVNASLFSLSAILGPPLMAGLFGWFTSQGAPFVFPGIAFAAAAGIALLSAAVFARALRHGAKKEPEEPAGQR